MKTGVLRTIGAVIAWGLLHSLTATRASKGVAARMAGKRAEEGLYRLAYNGVAIASTAALMLYLHRLPDRTLYRVRGPARVPLSAVRLALLLVAIRGAAEIGIGPFSGTSEAWAWLEGRPTFQPPEGQGPATDPDTATPGKPLKTGGPFRYVRHPLNASASALFLLTPTMTTVRLTLALLMLAYAVLGSKLEERRLLAMYGERYACYAAEVPFFLPRLRS